VDPTLGTAVESDDVVRAAAYGYHPRDDEDEDANEGEHEGESELQAAR
jgi:hypothetical protein